MYNRFRNDYQELEIYSVKVKATVYKEYQVNRIKTDPIPILQWTVNPQRYGVGGRLKKTINEIAYNNGYKLDFTETIIWNQQN